jgi:hypothetical protein
MKCATMFCFKKISIKSACKMAWLFLLLPFSVSAQPAADTSRPNPVTIAAVQQGVLACGSRINQVVNFLGYNEKSGALLMLPPTQRDQRIASLALELPLNSPNQSAYVSGTFAPYPANGCGASYEVIIYWPKNCTSTAKENYAQIKVTGKIQNNISVLDGGNELKVFLMPAGANGCISIKHELLY